MWRHKSLIVKHKPGQTEFLYSLFLNYPNNQPDQPAILGDQFAHQQRSDHPTDSKDGHGEGVQDGEELLVCGQVVVFFQSLIVEVFNVLREHSIIVVNMSYI